MGRGDKVAQVFRERDELWVLIFMGQQVILLMSPSYCSHLSPSKVLQQALEEFGEPWDLNPGDGAFYGPKASWNHT